MKRHLMIAGTGRAGTSFLVQYFHKCGLETHISLHPESQLDEHANAGLEDMPIDVDDLPYVIKTPWLYEFAEQLLSRGDITVDAVILPMRDIVEAASSRITIEMRARYGNPNLQDDCTRWGTWGGAPGGVIYSLNPVDQARILAMGFHQLVFELVKRDVPIVFLDFPRLVEDAEYLYQKIKPVLRDQVDHDTALTAHRLTANPALVRTGVEIAQPGRPQVIGEPQLDFPASEALDRAALLRELKRARGAENAASASLRQAEARIVALEVQANELKMRAGNDQASATLARDSLQTLRAQHESEIQAIHHAHTVHVANLEQTNARELTRVQQQVAEIQGSTFWRLTSPLRALLTRFKA